MRLTIELHLLEKFKWHWGGRRLKSVSVWFWSFIHPSSQKLTEKNLGLPFYEYCLQRQDATVKILSLSGLNKKLSCTKGKSGLQKLNEKKKKNPVMYVPCRTAFCSLDLIHTFRKSYWYFVGTLSWEEKWKIKLALKMHIKRSLQDFKEFPST